MEPDADGPRPHGAAPVATLIGVWSGVDLIVELTVIVIATWVNPLAVFAISLLVLTAVNTACCIWIERHWDGWAAGGSAAKIRRRPHSTAPWHLVRQSAGWISRGGDGWFALAAVATNAVTAVMVAHLLRGGPVGGRRVLIAALAWSLLLAGVGAAAGFVLGAAVSAA